MFHFCFQELYHRSAYSRRYVGQFTPALSLSRGHLFLHARPELMNNIQIHFFHFFNIWYMWLRSETDLLSYFFTHLCINMYKTLTSFATMPCVDILAWQHVRWAVIALTWILFILFSIAFSKANSIRMLAKTIVEFFFTCAAPTIIPMVLQKKHNWANCCEIQRNFLNQQPRISKFQKAC